MRDAFKLLTIGNSFTDSLAAFLGPVAAAAGRRVHFERANFGGCELARHWSYIEAEEADPLCRIYRGGSRLRDILAGLPWDLVTIQQASHDSWRPETFQPYARNIFDYVRRHAPGAEIAVQQTWAYRADDPRLGTGEGQWGVDQAGMYARLTENYRRLAADLGGLRIIPSGYAVELARAAESPKFVPYDPAVLSGMRWPDLPPQAGDVVGQMRWCKDEETGELRINRDLIHLNVRGQYLQACVWFATIFGRPVAETASFEPDELDARDAAMLRDAAQRAVDGFARS